ncbi:hypothetical protein AAG570_001195 [Ranatra chinensis]|uniref:KIND domain-containing protein n=1 Tax=Ranatra chinensis TaxID=642074 RepID=A0ABD0YB62_9HEMI
MFQECTVHLGSGGAQEAESHYRAVCRALVAEALELSSFLERVTPPSNAVLATTPTSATQLANLNFNDWVGTSIPHHLSVPKHASSSPIPGVLQPPTATGPNGYYSFQKLIQGGAG